MPGVVFAWLWTAVVLAIVVLLFDIIIAHDRVVWAEHARTAPPVARKSRKRRWLIVLAIVVAVAFVGEGFSLASGGYDPLHAAGPAIGSGSLYVGAEPGTYGGVDEVVFAAVPGGEIQMEFTLLNSGEFPMTVLGFDDSGGLASFGYVESAVLVPAGQSEARASRLFAIEAHASVQVVAHLHLKQCPEWIPTPTLAPGQSPSALRALAVSSAFMPNKWATLPVVYDMLGFRHVSNVVLPAYLTIAVLDQAGCGGINHSVDLPIGVHATPVPSFQYP